MKRPVTDKKTIMRHAKQAGMTLIEIMIALMLGLFLIAGLLQIFISNKHSYRLAEGQSRLQENGRYALELLSHDIRLAGYMGCSSVTATNPVVIANDPLVAPEPHLGIPAVVQASTVTGGDNNAAGTFNSPNPALSAALNGAIIGTDAITVQFGESCGGYTSAATTSVNPTGIIAAGNTCGITNGTGVTFATIGTPLIISDCSTAHVFRASAGTSQNKDAVPAGAGAATSILIGKAAGYAAGSEILRFRSYTYFLQLGTSGQPALWRLDNNYPVLAGSNPEELIEGIENMQVTYGLDTDAVLDGSANRYIAAPTAAQWPIVVSVRVVLTARSIDDNIMSELNNTPNNPARPYNGGNLSDRRLFKTFTANIDLRNR